MLARPEAFAVAEGDGEPALYRDVIVVGASAGGVEALGRLSAGLPPELPASVFVVLHMLSTGTSVLHTIMARSGNLPASAAVDGERFDRGHIYVAPPDQHLLIWDGHIRLSLGPRENGHRPAIDPLFRSAARSFGPRVIAVVLSGALDDGAAGMRFVKERGGAALVQDPDDALYPAMPRNAASFTDVDRVEPVNRMGDAICEVIETPVETDADTIERAAGGWRAEDLEERAEGAPSGLTCPECGGALWQRDEGPLVRFACRTGHAFSPDSLVNEQSKSLEVALWSALRGLEERADLFRRMARRAGDRPGTVRRLEARARAAEQHAEAVREAVAKLGPRVEPDPEAEPAA
jgi:two-component system, chemotaxis family, protein-glutamate methylesterase/glutaminase